MQHLLIVEDDRDLAGLVAEYLGAQGYRVSVVYTGPEAIRRIAADPPDLVILDVMLPGADGFEVCRSVRPAYQGKILMLTARGDEIDQVVGLELGADDYAGKPVSPRLLLARVRALLRRAPPNGEPEGEKLTFGPLVLDHARREVRLAGALVDLTTAQYELLWLLASHAGQVLTRQEIFEALRGIDYDGLDRSMDVRISQLRMRVGDDPKSPRLIKTIRGTGYLFARPE